MLDNLKAFFAGNYAPHGYCLLWQPELVWTHVISDALIAAAYFSIPVALITFVRRRPDVAFGKMFWLFALFILSCGLTHVMGIWNLWPSVTPCLKDCERRWRSASGRKPPWCRRTRWKRWAS
jgi:hypothetical protein